LAVSDEAGKYFCEFQLYCSLAKLYKTDKAGKAVFFHTPLSQEDKDIKLGAAVAVELITELVNSMGL